ncbi:MAG TPA: MogA/MoaB family molybdenum cofactor biosynthesis protein [Candidatus Limnocylindrales bacterium]|nr:MogA/MoaB family molybdenum cofactor biosynthesis protein [Candidatus Limnocylindrales bacterium]
MTEPAAPASRRAFVLTISDGVAAGVRDDESGWELERRLAGLRFEVRRGVVPDEREAIRTAIVDAVETATLVLTTGGTGLTPRDVTPQATEAIVEYQVPGIAEAMRAEGRRMTPLAALSRGIVGVRAGALIVNLPGSPKGALESLEAILPILDHALQTLAGPVDHGSPARGRAADR